MYLIQLFLPLYDNANKPFATGKYHTVRDELLKRFDGLTAHTQAPAEGLWKDDAADTKRDDIVIYEVMADNLDRKWWRQYRRTLEKRFRQEQIVVRAQAIELL